MTQTLAPTLGDATVQELREAIRGQVLRPGDDGYLDACRIWNGAFDERRPAAIVRCAGAADVIATVGFARSNGLPLAVRGGGHSIPGFSSVDDGVVLDLSPMRDVRVDPAARRAEVGPGATWADVDHEAQAHALATTGGLVSTTGVAGFTLGGGIGWLMRKRGLACDNLVGADVVTADGRLVHASAEENADLLWGLRGGGGNFGVVTRFELDLHPVGPIVYAGLIFFSAEHDVALARMFRDWAPGAPDDITAALNLTTAPPLPVVPEAWHGKKVTALIVVSAGSAEEAEAQVRPFREAFEPVADLLGPMPYLAMQSLIDPLWPKGIRAYFKATNLTGVDDALIDSLHELHLSSPGPQCEIHLHQMGGAVARVAEADTAFPERSMPFVVNAVTGWQDPDADEAHAEWARAVIESASDASTGRAYVNFLGDADAAQAAYGAEKYEALQALKRKYDPTNVFRLNQNIEPGDEA
jgi:FAD/FMN-containing dehydrogenase